jgi:hypothetical protein
MHDLIASRFLDDCLVVRPGSVKGLRISDLRYRELVAAAQAQTSGSW